MKTHPDRNRLTHARQEFHRLQGRAWYVGATGFRPEGEYPGGFAFYPTRGDCVSTPVTETKVFIYGWLMT